MVSSAVGTKLPRGKKASMHEMSLVVQMRTLVMQSTNFTGDERSSPGLGAAHGSGCSLAAELSHCSVSLE
jgi:hypothetical protein